jgi:site-specific DNA recombinase
MAETPERKRAVIYTRVSSKEQVGGYSLETQERTCHEYAARLGYDISKVFVERGESAKTANRTELQNMLRYIVANSKSLEAVIVYKVDRLDCNTVDHAQLKVLFLRYGLRLLSATESFDDTPVGKLMENQLTGFAQFDNDIRIERCRNGMVAAVATGRYVWVAPPWIPQRQFEERSEPRTRCSRGCAARTQVVRAGRCRAHSPRG